MYRNRKREEEKRREKKGAREKKKGERTDESYRGRLGLSQIGLSLNIQK
jgi:hypothetical protein